MQVRTLYRQGTLVLAANVVNALLVTAVLWRSVAPAVLVSWTAAMCVVTLVRLQVRRAYWATAHTEADSPKWRRASIVGAAMSGILWGVAGWLFFVPDSAMAQLLITFVLGGMGAGAAATLSSWLPAFHAYFLPSVVPLTLRLVLVGDSTHYAMAGMAAIYCFVFMGIARNINASLMDSHRLRFYNDHLFEELSAARERLSNANASLERQVASGTAEIARQAKALEQSKQKIADAAARTTALDESEASLLAISAAALDSILTLDATGKIERVNPAATRMFGRSARELVGQDAEMLVSPSEREHDETRGPASQAVREVTGHRKNGTTFPAELCVAEYAVGAQKRCVWIVRDITERRKLQLSVGADELRIRTAIAYDLHDFVGQNVAAARILTQNVARDAPSGVRERLTRIVSVLGETLERVRNMARYLSAVEVDSSLDDALLTLAEETRTIFGLNCTLELQPNVPEPAPQQKSQAYLVAREAILNAAKHSAGANVRIAFGVQNGWYRLSVCDDGTGISEDSLRISGVGLSSMEHRARLLGGNLRIERAARSGTEVHLLWPCED